VLLVREAGGTVTDFKGGSDGTFGGEIIASNEKIHAEFLDVIQSRFSLR
jgi:myo-inositol-1(or 4)-monophosphatase